MGCPLFPNPPYRNSFIPCLMALLVIIRRPLPAHLEEGQMRFKTKLNWFLIFDLLRCVVKILHSVKQVFLIITDKHEQLCFTSLKHFLINFSRFIFRYWPHNLLYVIFAIEKIYSLMFSFFNIFIKVFSKSVADGLAHRGLH